MANGEILVDFRLASTLTTQTVTGDELASFADELVANAKTYVDKYREDLNQSIMKPIILLAKAGGENLRVGVATAIPFLFE